MVKIIRACFLSLVTCFFAYGRMDAGEAPEPIFWVSVADLQARGKDYDAKRVAVLGYYVMEAPVSAMYSSDPASEPKSDFFGRMLWIGGDSEKQGAESVKRSNRVWCVIIGRYSARSQGIFDMYFGSIAAVEKFIIVTSPVPKN